MGKTDARSLSAQLKKGELSRIYYLFGADVTGVEDMTRRIIKAAVGDNEAFALTKMNGRKLNFSELVDVIGQFPMMSDYNCVLINDFNCEKPFEDMRGQTADDVTKKLLDVLKDVPDQTVVILNVTGFEMKIQWDFRANCNVIKDKNKKLADFAEKNGTVCEFPMKNSADLSKIIASKVSARGGAIALDVAKELAEMCLCDELVIGNEIEKLTAYADGRDITMEMLKELVHVQNDTTVYNLANAVAALNAQAAFDAINELNVDSDNRGAVLYAVTNAFLDLYRAACAKRAGATQEQMAADFGYGKRAFVVRNAFRDSSRMSVEHLRECLAILRDTTMKLNSAPIDPRIAIEEAVVKMLRPDGKRGRR